MPGENVSSAPPSWRGVFVCGSVGCLEVDVAEDYYSQMAEMKRGAREADAGAAKAGESCPIATQDIKTNLKNRQKAIDTAMYGPPNPQEPNEDYWKKMAGEWGTSVDQAKTMRCGNCAAFVVTQKMRDCIKAGLEKGGDIGDAYDTIVQADLGYCEAFDFKCAASRTCRAWVAGGPVQ